MSKESNKDKVPQKPSPAAMKAKELQELIDFIAKSGLNKVNIETEEFKISVQREPSTKYVSGGAAPAPVQHQAPAPAATAAPAPQAAPAAPSPAAVQAPAEAPVSNTVALRAPMIGTFYRSNSPDNPPFVSVGDVVEQGQVICIIEAMKLFNEIEAEQRGRIVKAMVENASPVEYDQPLFIIEPM